MGNLKRSHIFNRMFKFHRASAINMHGHTSLFPVVNTSTEVSECVYTYMYTYVNVYMYMYVNVYMEVHSYCARRASQVFSPTLSAVPTRYSICIYIQNIYTCVYKCICIYICICICTYILSSSGKVGEDTRVPRRACVCGCACIVMPSYRRIESCTKGPRTEVYSPK